MAARRYPDEMMASCHLLSYIRRLHSDGGTAKYLKATSPTTGARLFTVKDKIKGHEPGPGIRNA
jgi:hypothetical protein